MTSAVKDIGLTAEEASTYTNWEFNEVLSNTKYLKSTMFYRNGLTVPVKQVLQEYSEAIKNTIQTTK